jgi:hypothetical protein
MWKGIKQENQQQASQLFMSIFHASCSSKDFPSKCYYKLNKIYPAKNKACQNPHQA